MEKLIWAIVLHAVIFANLSSDTFDNICQNLPEEFDILVHGNHRKCYQNFTNISRLKRTVSNVNGNEASPYKKEKIIWNYKCCLRSVPI